MLGCWEGAGHRTEQRRDRDSVRCRAPAAGGWTGASGRVGAPPDTSARGAVISDLGFMGFVIPSSADLA